MPIQYMINCRITSVVFLTGFCNQIFPQNYDNTGKLRNTQILHCYNLFFLFI